jgi:hypothetical protein
MWQGWNSNHRRKVPEPENPSLSEENELAVAMLS